MRVSYAVGAWYAESAPQETQKFASIGKKLDLQAFSQGFTDKINNRLQLPQAKLGRTRRRATAAGNRHAVQE